MSDQANSSKSGSVVAIAIAIVSLIGTVTTGYFTWSSSKDIAQIKAGSLKDLEILRQTFEKYKIERESADKDAASNKADKSLRCSSMKELQSTMAQDLSSLYEKDEIGIDTKVNRLRANAVKAFTFFGPDGEAAYLQGTSRRLKPGETKIVNDLSAAVAALMVEIRACNAK